MQLVSRGQCGCLGYDLTQGDDYEILYESMMGLDGVIGSYDADTKRQVVAAVCNSTIAIGDHLQVRIYVHAVQDLLSNDGPAVCAS